ncbi:glycosyltransferase family 4 protein [Humisphaera borealis]|uniref:Glycosyltransferase family 4 protein n=1 Tax=Humisphaera borealis TaxID=2807512 RepID=A0A7M2WYN1_9BACT|nr:glycosyltransferase family 4 protein [Humisphaera borealis]
MVELATRFHHDHEVHVFTNTVDATDTPGITFHHVPAWRPNALASILSFIVPATLLVRGPFDIVHAQGLCGFRHNLTTAHICQRAWFEGLERMGMRLSWRQRLFKTFVTPLERLALCQPATRRVIAVSERIRLDLADAYGRTEGVEVIYHGTDNSTFRPDNRTRFRDEVRADLGLSNDGFMALYVGDVKKGAAAAIRATEKVPGVTLLIVSSSDVSYVESLAASLGVQDRVVFSPHSTRVEKLFAAADAFVFPTIYESFGLVITEAMASGLPVITNRAAGAAELIDDGVNGLLTDEPWDIDQIARHLACLRDNPRLRSEIGLAARAKVEAYTWDRTAQQTMAVYRKILQEQA